MYLDFFGFTKIPFGDTPEVHLFWDGNDSYEIFSALLEAINKGDRLQMVIGEPGLGKSVLCRKLFNSLRSHKTRYHALCLPSPHIRLEELLNTEPGSQFSHDLPTIVLIDEAQAMSDKALKFLSEVLQGKKPGLGPVQVILFAQPELCTRLAQRAWEPLQHQVCQTHLLNPFTEPLTRDYLYCRVAESGGNPETLFDNDLLAELQKSSGGVPRLINSLMRKALIHASEESSNTLNSKHIRKAMTTMAITVP